MLARLPHPHQVASTIPRISPIAQPVRQSAVAEIAELVRARPVSDPASCSIVTIPTRQSRDETARIREGRRDAPHMTTLMITHDVDDVEHWLASPKREEVFGPLGISARTCVDSDRSNHVGLIVEVPDIDTLQRVLASDEAAAAMKHDGVQPETLHIMVQS